MQKSDIITRFSTPNIDEAEKGLLLKTLIDKKYRELAEFIDKVVPGTREKFIAVERLEESMIWAYLSIAREEEYDEP